MWKIGRKHTKESILKMKETAIKKGFGKWWIGKKHTPETKLKMRIARLGKGIPHTREAKFKMSVSSLGRRHSEETKKKLSLMRIGNKNPAWKGGRSVTKNGYVIIWVEGVGRIKEHKYVYEQKFGPVPKGMELHHINAVKYDNRIENLQLVTRAEHNKIEPRHANKKEKK